MLSRRIFIGSVACAAASRAGLATPPFESRKLREFAYGDVKLTAGPIGDMYRRIHAHFLKLDEDRLLKVYGERPERPERSELDGLAAKVRGALAGIPTD